MDINELVEAIKLFYSNNKKAPTISEFSKENNIHAAVIIRKFGSWNNLLSQAGLKPNKSNKRTKEQLLLWLKAHPNSKYSEIPSGIRSALIDNFESISKARTTAGLSISDWRILPKKQYRKNPNAGRPIEYSKEKIIEGLSSLAVKLGRPPKQKDIKKTTCGFPYTAILSRFKSFNEALQAASLPPTYSYHEYNKLNKDLSTIMLNVKLNTNDVPIFYNLEIEGFRSTFVYEDRYEEVFLTRSDVAKSINKLIAKKKDKKMIAWYLVDDSLFENDNIEIKDILNYSESINKILSDALLKLRLRYDEINRKYIAPMYFIKTNQVMNNIEYNNKE